MNMDHDQSRYMLVELAAQASMTARSVVRKLISCRRSYNSPVKLGLRHRILQSLAMAWNPPMRENSRSYWKAAETTNQRIKNDFLFSLRPVFVRSFLRCGDIIYLSPVERLDESSEEGTQRVGCGIGGPHIFITRCNGRRVFGSSHASQLTAGGRQIPVTAQMASISQGRRPSCDW